MNRYRLSKAGISAAEGIGRFNGDAALYESILMKFPDDALFAELVSAIEERDVKTAFIAAHSLKGAAGNLSMNKLFSDITPLVEELRAGSLVRAGELLIPVKADYEAIIAALA